MWALARDLQFVCSASQAGVFEEHMELPTEGIAKILPGPRTEYAAPCMLLMAHWLHQIVLCTFVIFPLTSLFTFYDLLVFLYI